MSQPTIPEIERLVAQIESMMHEAQGSHDFVYGRSWERHARQGREIIETLVKYEGARYRPSSAGTSFFKLAGIQTSCTAGTWGLLRNWRAAAWRRRHKLIHEAAP